MDIRILTKLVLKLGGIWLLIVAVLSLPALLVAPAEYVGLGYIAVGLYFAVAFVLLWFPGVLINRVLLIGGTDLEGSATPELLLRIGLILMGVYFTVTALWDLAYTWASARWFYAALQPFPGSRGPDMSPEQFGSMVAGVVKLIAGIVLWGGAPLMARVIGRFK